MRTRETNKGVQTLPHVQSSIDHWSCGCQADPSIFLLNYKNNEQGENIYNAAKTSKSHLTGYKKYGLIIGALLNMLSEYTNHLN